MLESTSHRTTWFLRPSRGRSAFVFAIAALLLLGGIILLGMVSPGAAPDIDDLTQTPAVLAVVGFGVMVLEAVVFTILPIEATRRLWRRPGLGAAIGAATYGPIIHWDNGWLGLSTSIWIIAVVSGAYLIERPSSLARAICQAVGLKLLFWVFALSALLSDA
ncbi:hypothetical protein [Brevundimonas sp. UBA7534]|uniref:hypothetical protein n=1 Tax=Brevundimonas sp. UBA7534 TaxID=1946138 RepID=UPI0025BE742E|nr:hypothetical protein [Brevundimonas sp. UBA7534]